MAQGNEVEYVTLVRVIEYYGPAKWVNDTLKSSAIPLRGVREFPVGSYIRSGVVMWEQPAAEMPSGQPGSKPITTVPPAGGAN